MILIRVGKDVVFIKLSIFNLLGYIKQKINIGSVAGWYYEADWYHEEDEDEDEIEINIEDKTYLRCYDVSQFFTKKQLRNLKDAQEQKTRQYISNNTVLFIFYFISKS